MEPTKNMNETENHESQKKNRTRPFIAFSLEALQTVHIAHAAVASGAQCTAAAAHCRNVLGRDLGRLLRGGRVVSAGVFSAASAAGVVVLIAAAGRRVEVVAVQRVTVVHHTLPCPLVDVSRIIILAVALQREAVLGTVHGLVRARQMEL